MRSSSFKNFFLFTVFAIVFAITSTAHAADLSFSLINKQVAAVNADANLSDDEKKTKLSELNSAADLLKKEASLNKEIEDFDLIQKNSDKILSGLEYEFNSANSLFGHGAPDITAKNSDELNLLINDFTLKQREAQSDLSSANSDFNNLQTLPSKAQTIISENALTIQNLTDKINTIIDAKRSRKTMRICYHDYRGETTTRDIDPYCLVYHDGCWYAYSFCHLRRQMRLFKIARITHMTFTGGVFIPESRGKSYNFNLAPPAEKVQITLKIAPEGRYDAEDWLGVENVKPSDDGINFLATGTVPANAATYAKIIKFGKNAEVVSPPSVKRAVIVMCEEFLSANK